jgi:hypothetical protein
VEQRKQGRRSDGRFLGFWARLNCEEMPVIPAWLVRANLGDPRKIPYLLVWKDERHDPEIKEAVRLTCHADGYSGYVQLKRTDASTTVLGILWRELPRNGGRALFLFCPHCQVPRRFVYGWEWDSFSGWSNRVRSISWRCRSCAQLRYSSEGGYLRGSGRGAIAASFARLSGICRVLSRGSLTFSRRPRKRQRRASARWMDNRAVETKRRVS